MCCFWLMGLVNHATWLVDFVRSVILPMKFFIPCFSSSPTPTLTDQKYGDNQNDRTD